MQQNRCQANTKAQVSVQPPLLVQYKQVRTIGTAFGFRKTSRGRLVRECTPCRSIWLLRRTYQYQYQYQYLVHGQTTTTTITKVTRCLVSAATATANNNKQQQHQQQQQYGSQRTAVELQCRT